MKTTKYIMLAVLSAAAVINTQAGEVGIGLSLVNWKKTVGGQTPPVYYAPAAPVAPVVQQTAAAPAAPAAQQPTMVAVPAANGTYTLVPIVAAQPVAQTYLIPASQVPLTKPETSWSIGPRLSLFANK
jgi:hypothetical protein